MKKVILAILLPMMLHSFAQQQPQYSQYMLNQYSQNPAVGGTEDYAPISISYRRQWLGMSKAPSSFYLSGHTPVGKVLGDYSKAHLNKVPNYHGLGGLAYSDRSGPTRQHSINVSYAYNMKITSSFRLSSGISLGVKNFSINNAEIEFHDEGDPTAESAGINTFSPDASLGFWGYTNMYYVGLSIHHLFNNKLDNTLESIDREYSSRLNRHFFLSSGIQLPINESVVFVPSFMLKYVTPAPISIDFNAKFLFYDQYWVGATVRTRDGIGAFAGINFAKSWALGYSYEYTTSKLRPYQAGSHEILVTYKLPLPGSVICPSKFW